MTGQGWEEISKTIGESRADGAGRAEFRFATPDDLGGTHGLWIDAGGKKKIGSYWIKPTALPMDVTRGPAGTTFTIHLKGVGWTETPNLYNLASANTYTASLSPFTTPPTVQ